MDLGTEWLLLSSDGGHNRSPFDTGDNSGRLPSKSGDRICNHTGRGIISNVLGRRDGWQNEALVRASWLPPLFPGGGYAGAHLLEALDRPATG